MQRAKVQATGGGTGGAPGAPAGFTLFLSAAVWHCMVQVLTGAPAGFTLFLSTAV